MPEKPTMKKTVHTQRSELMRKRLIETCIESLIDIGYARTTTVEICARAGVTRGALVHHFTSLAALLAESLRFIYAGYLSEEQLPDFEEAERKRGKLDETARLILVIWSRIGQREFKAVIELWLAARNDSELRKTLGPVIDEFAQTIKPTGEDNEVSDDKKAVIFRMVIETMIGLALGRAVSMTDTSLAHEDAVLSILIELVLNAP